MSLSLVGLVYILSIAAFILGLKRLASPKTAPLGNLIGAFGMGLAVLATVVTWSDGGVDVSVRHNLVWIFVVMALASVVGWALAKKIEMTAMPQLVAAFNGFGGLASAFVALSEVTHAQASSGVADVTGSIPAVAVLSVVIGAITFTGSFVAFAKLQGMINTAPVTFPGIRLVNGALLLVCLVLTVVFATNMDNQGWVWAVLPFALVLGWTATNAIGGADMPVVVALLNSFSGIAASAAGYVTVNEPLVVAGALVGASGLILTAIMCRGMNRTLAHVLFAAFGTADSGGGGGAAAGGPARTVRNFTPEDGAILLANARSVIVVPGYGLAVAQAQHNVRELADLLIAKGVDVKYAIHPVAGRMPGHMNVLLAEANVPYDQLLDLDQVNPYFETADVALVIGANDVVNPSARNDPSSPIYGMPILDADKSRNVIILKRSLGTGFAGTDNELFFDPKTMMLFGDAKKTVLALVSEVKAL
ncbi:MAG: NAD(P)(+) transhydrogenase (Re/Si-specific) subunit beta [Planctomycetota bacterium]